MKIQIRPVKLNEVPRVQQITQLAYQIPYKEGGIVTNPHEPKDIEEKIKGSGIFIFVAVSDGEIVGAVRCEIQGNDRLYFSHLAVLEDYRNQGIGSRLVNVIEEFGKTKKLKYVALDCLKEKRLDEYYEKIGYKMDKIRKDKGRHEVFMSKYLLG